MKITLLNVSGKIGVNKDTAGGYGTNFSIGDSFFAKLISSTKKGIDFPIITLAYLAAIFRKNSHKVNIMTNKIPYDADLVIIPSSIIDYKTEIYFAKKIKQKTKAKVGFIRPFASLMPKPYLEAGDFIIKGEPEEVAMKISNKYIPKGLVESKPLPLEKLPFPDWDGFPVKEYSYSPSLNKQPFLPVLSSRGCPHQCSYCPYIIEWKWRKPRDPENVIEEIKYLVRKYKVKSIMFRDPVFTLNMKRTEKISDLIIKNKIKIEFGCETRIDDLTISLLKKMYKAGLRTIEVGVETPDEKFLKAGNRKPIPMQYQEKIIKFCNKIGIKASVFYILGFPGQTVKDIKSTINYAKKLNTFVAQFMIHTPYPGTPEFEKLKHKIYETNIERFDAYTPTYYHEKLTRKQLLKLKEYAYTSYFFRLAWMFKHWRNRLR